MSINTFPPRRSTRTDKPFSPGRRRRADFARQAVFAAFGSRYGKALDQADFIDRAPGELPGPSPEARQ